MDNQPQVMLLTLRFRAPWCRSLKDRRSEVKRLSSRLRAQFNLSVVESGEQGVHTLFELTLAALCFGSQQADSIQQSVHDFVEGLTEAELYEINTELL